MQDTTFQIGQDSIINAVDSILNDTSLVQLIEPIANEGGSGNLSLVAGLLLAVGALIFLKKSKSKAGVKVQQAWKDQNFWLTVTLLIGGFWVGFSEQDATILVGSVFALIASIGQMANFFKNAQMDIKKWLTNANFYSYLSVIILSLFPAFPGEIFDIIQDVLTDLINKNWNGLFSALGPLIVFLYKIFTTKQEPAP